jgi:hypothetical protein
LQGCLQIRENRAVRLRLKEACVFSRQSAEGCRTWPNRRQEKVPHHTEVDPLPKLDSAAAICKWIAQLAQEVNAGRLDPKVARSLTQRAHLLLHALPAADVEKEQNKMQLPDDFWMPNISAEHKEGEISNEKKSKEA